MGVGDDPHVEAGVGQTLKGLGYAGEQPGVEAWARNDPGHIDHVVAPWGGTESLEEGMDERFFGVAGWGRATLRMQLLDVR